MYRPVIAGAVISLGLLAPAEESDRPHALFKEEQMTVHHTPAAGEATIVVKAETEEALQHVEVRSPTGGRMLRMHAQDGMRIALQGFVLETKEMEMAELLRTYPPGRYDLRGLVEGRVPITGGAVLTHDLLPEPHVLAPVAGELHAPTEGLVVEWAPEPGAVAYRIGVEQNDADGLTIELPATATSFRIPDGFLKAGTPTQVEVGVVAPGGNTTFKEVEFTTQ